MTNLFKFNDYSLIEVGTKENQLNYQQISIDISNNHEIDKFQSLILVSIEKSNDVATYAVNNGYTFDINHHALTMEIRLTNKAINGSGSIEETQRNDFDYVIFYNSIMEDKYKYNDKSLFYSSVELIDDFSHVYNESECYFIMPRTQQFNVEGVNIGNTNIGVMLINSNNSSLTAYGKWKDSGNGGNSGGNYSGYDYSGKPANISFLAINKNISKFTHNNSPIIQVGYSTTDVNGVETVNHNISSNDYIIMLTPVVHSKTNEYISILYTNKSNYSFSVNASYKDGNNGADGGGTNKAINFYWGVIKKF